MRDVKYREHRGHNGNECQLMPRTASERGRLALCFRLHGRQPREIFKYSCPVCRSQVTTPPAANVMLASILNTLKGTGESIGAETETVGTRVPPPLSFVGFFLCQEV